jgi:hypothetical protein
METIDGPIETQIYTTEGGYVALKQAREGSDDAICLLTADQLPEIIGRLQALYEERKRWEEAAAE